MHPRRETRVMHFIARFNSSVRLFNQTSLPLALVLNVGGCDPFQAAARANGREGERKPFRPQNPTSRAIGTSHPRASRSRRGWRERSDNARITIQHLLFRPFVRICSEGELPSSPLSCIFISAPPAGNNMLQREGGRGGGSRRVAGGSEIPRSGSDAVYAVARRSRGIEIIEEP